MDARDVEGREVLLNAVEERLRADPRVEWVARFGSLAADPDVPDEFSDIDLDVFVKAPASDHDFAPSVVHLLGEIAPVRATRTVWLPGFAYVESVWFEGYSPYWNVDVRCRAAEHRPDAEHGRKDEWADGYTHWLLAVKRLVRAFRFLGDHRAAVAGTENRLSIPSVVVDDLRALLHLHHATAQTNEGSNAFLELCFEIDDTVLDRLVE